MIQISNSPKSRHSPHCPTVPGVSQCSPAYLPDTAEFWPRTKAINSFDVKLHWR